MIFASILTIALCIVLLFGAVVLLVLNHFKDEPPTWEQFLNNNKKHWRVK